LPTSRECTELKPIEEQEENGAMREVDHRGKGEWMPFGKSRERMKHAEGK